MLQLIEMEWAKNGGYNHILY